jgi:hypothetical protein
MELRRAEARRWRIFPERCEHVPTAPGHLLTDDDQDGHISSRDMGADIEIVLGKEE